ncbi:hypothetical protein NP493_6344g00003 [Ridgeia piscesae]|uniref:Uncharacterized protein n=1 Tax=Ridgeia piscesae TaxID=27915 RepID=A0AAD9IRJ3_RIDPI|nr:hypothetical protein NP493_6344g00003 [Ridgeia piscesae]
MVSGADSVYGLLGDPCNCQNYYQCEYNTTTEQFIAIQRSCNPVNLGSGKSSPVSGMRARETALSSPLPRELASAHWEWPTTPHSSFLGNETMDCAPGTTLNPSLCAPVSELNHVTIFIYLNVW